MVDSGVYRREPLITKMMKKVISDYLSREGAISTNAAKPQGLNDSIPVEVQYITGRWVQGLPDEHQWDRVTHYKPQPAHKAD